MLPAACRRIAVLWFLPSVLAVADKPRSKGQRVSDIACDPALSYGQTRQEQKLKAEIAPGIETR